jgi:hypothetical protein
MQSASNATAEDPRATRIVGGVLVLAVACCVGGACGSDGPLPLQALSACTGSWDTPLPSLNDWVDLAYADGVLYYNDQWSGIWSRTRGVGPSTSVASFSASAFGHAHRSADMWVESDRVVFTAGERENLFYSVPLAGGDPQLLLDAGALRPDAGWAEFHALAPAQFVWTESSDATGSMITVWRAARSDAAPIQIGAAQGPVLGIGVAGDAAIVAIGEGRVYAFPFDGSGGRALATSPELAEGPVKFAGMDEKGVFWRIPRPGATPTDVLYSVVIVPADGGPVRTFWNGSPTHSTPDLIASDGMGAWIAVVGQAFVEGFGSSVWSIDARGTGRRLACSPPGVNALSDAIAIAPDAVFTLALRDVARLEIDRIPR